MGANAGLGDFLRTRRDRLRPEDLGLRAGAKRRVPGLRREELAYLAGVSTDYLVRLEQGRDIHPSASVLTALADALRLGRDERAHLRTLADSARHGAGDCRRRLPPQRVRPGARRLFDAIPDAPAMIVGRWLTVLDQNPLSAALTGDLRGTNLLRFVFLRDEGRALYPDWDRVAAELVGFLRSHTAAGGGDLGLCELAGELLLGSDTFARLWADHHVRDRPFGTTRFAHPRLGTVTLDYEMLALPDQDQWLIVHTPATDADHAAMGLLGALATF